MLALVRSRPGDGTVAPHEAEAPLDDIAEIIGALPDTSTDPSPAEVGGLPWAALALGVIALSLFLFRPISRKRPLL